jgi:capsular exopolysaccharide synthesis family protein
VTEKNIVLPPGSSGNGNDVNYRLTMMVPKRRYLSYLRERWWVVLACLVVTVSTVLVYETVRQQKYNSFAQIYVTGGVQINGVAGLLNEEDLTYFGTQVELLKSARLRGAAYEKAGIILNPDQKNPYAIDVFQPMKTSILELQATGPDPVLTQKLLQVLINEYLAYKKETRITTSQDILDSLQDELEKKAASLQTEEDIWAEFQKSNNVAVLVEEGRSAGMYLSDLQMELAKSRLEQKLLSQGIEPESIAATSSTNFGSMNVVGAVALSSTNSMPLAAPPTTTNSVATTDDSEYNSVRLDLAVLLANKEDKIRAMGEHGFQQEVVRLQRLIAIMIADKRIRLEERILAVEAAIPLWETKVLDINGRLSQSERLKENVTREQGYYDHLLGMLQNVDLGKNVQQEQISLLQPATTVNPEKRHLVLRIALAVIGGLFFGLGLVYVWYMADDRFVSVRDIKDQFGEKVLGLVPQIKTSRNKPQQALLENSDARHAYIESYRHLRSALLLASTGESRPQTLLFTSPGQAEGKTTLAANLARLLARSGLRVVLVDVDARGGGLNRLLGQTAGPGLLDYLRGNVTAQSLVQPTEFPGLFLVPGGTYNEQSEGLFLGSKICDLLLMLRQNADFVILDGAPILASDDAAFLVSHVDTVVLITRPFYTRSRLLRQALDMLYQRHAKDVNIILNRARAEDLAGHYEMNGIVPPMANRKHQKPAT